MASSTLTAYETSSVTKAFALAQVSATATTYILSGRAISLPYKVSIERKIGNSNASSNDHVLLRISRIEANATTAKPATFQATLDISIPKDQSILTPVEQKKVLALIASMLNDGAAVGATNANTTALIEGRDL